MSTHSLAIKITNATTASESPAPNHRSSRRELAGSDRMRTSARVTTQVTACPSRRVPAVHLSAVSALRSILTEEHDGSFAHREDGEVGRHALDSTHQ